jgi:predicted unusual protein kinase regulating ubiquinone biosynthesis (AarF/ABC1/UbiB family)
VKQYTRLLRIYRTAARYRLHELLEGSHLTRLAGFLLRLPVPLVGIKQELSRGRRLRLALEELGPIFIKFGQLLSTRRDMVPADLADELALLQDQVAPFDPAPSPKQLIEEAPWLSTDRTYSASFSVAPLASASVAQVHAATVAQWRGSCAQGDPARHRQDHCPRCGPAAHRSPGWWKPAIYSMVNACVLREVVRDYEHVIFDELNLLA